MIAGFEEPTAGQILLYGKDVVGVPPNHRDVNMVFQNYALFPHMTVFDNVAFGLRRKTVRQGGDRARGSTRCSSWSSSRAGPSAGPASCPVASSSGSRWRARWSTGRVRCCWTSRSAPWT